MQRNLLVNYTLKSHKCKAMFPSLARFIIHQRLSNCDNFMNLLIIVTFNGIMIVVKVLF